VRKVTLAVVLVACFVGVAMAADHATSVARPDVVAGPPAPVHPFVNVHGLAKSTTIFVSDAEDGVVNFYNTSGKQLGQLTGFEEPQGLASDTNGNVYVADTENARIQVYAPPYKKTPKTLSDPGYYPAGVSVLISGKTTYVGATNICSDPDCTQGGFAFWKNGKAIGAPWQSSNIYRVYFGAFDAKGNFYADGENSSGDLVIGVIPNAIKGKTTFNVLTTGNSIEFPGGVEVTLKGDIAIDDQDAATVYTYAPPKNGSLGSPIETTSLSGSSDAVTFAFTSTDGDLWTADAGLAESLEFAYPAGGSAVTTITVGGQPIGVAVVPAQK